MFRRAIDIIGAGIDDVLARRPHRGSGRQTAATRSNDSLPVNPCKGRRPLAAGRRV
jgi:hypothetical protein